MGSELDSLFGAFVGGASDNEVPLVDDTKVNKMLQTMGYGTIDETQRQRMLNNLMRTLSGMQSGEMRAFGERQAGKSGGRLGSAERGYDEIGGKYAQVLGQGVAQIDQTLMSQEMQKLQLYIQKYGYDKNAEMAMKQLQAQSSAATGAAIGDFASSLLLLAFL